MQHQDNQPHLGAHDAGAGMLQPSGRAPCEAPIGEEHEDSLERAPTPFSFSAEIGEMVFLAGRLAASGDAEEIDRISFDLAARVTEHLSAGRDDVLNRAVGAALIAHGEASVAALLELIEESATSWVSTLSEGGRISTTVAVIPVYIGTDFMETLPRSLESDAGAFNDLAESLRRYGLVRAQGCAYVLPGLYTREEIEAVPFSRVFRLARHMTAVLEGERSLNVPDIQDRDTAFPSSPTLRFVIVGHRDDEAVCPFLPFYQEGGDIAPDFEASVMEWASEFSESLRRCIGGVPDTTVMVTPPEPFFLGLRTGAQQHRTAVFHFGTRAQLESAGVDTEDVRALVYSLGKGYGTGEVIVTYLNWLTGEHVGSMSLPTLPWTSLEADRRVTLRALTNLGIKLASIG
jgi:hypothetical protein